MSVNGAIKDATARGTRCASERRTAGVKREKPISHKEITERALWIASDVKPEKVNVIDG